MKQRKAPPISPKKKQQAEQKCQCPACGLQKLAEQYCMTELEKNILVKCYATGEATAVQLIFQFHNVNEEGCAQFVSVLAQILAGHVAEQALMEESAPGNVH